MIIRILGLIGAILGILWLLGGAISFSYIAEFCDNYNSVKTATLFKIPIACFITFYGIKWALYGYGKK